MILQANPIHIFDKLGYAQMRRLDNKEKRQVYRPIALLLKYDLLFCILVNPRRVKATH
jgi:hypothetical protein